MVFPSVIIKIASTFLPLVREYLSSKDNRKDILSLRSMTAWVIMVLVLTTGCSLYLSEQATANLAIHEPITKQYNQLYQQNIKTKEHLQVIQEALVKCEAKVENTLTTCTAAVPKVPEFTYDPKTHTLIPMEIVKK